MIRLTKTNKKLIVKWYDELRNPEHVQTVGCLMNTQGCMCAEGVFAMCVVDEIPEDRAYGMYVFKGCTADYDHPILGIDLNDPNGGPNQYKAWYLNDAMKLTLPEIAEWVKATWPDLESWRDLE